jgi:RNA polymerase sigma-70 factor (ECF subfamily)
MMLAIIMAIEDEQERNKIEEVYNRYYSTMLYIAKDILHDEGLAEDAVSESFIKIINNVEKIREVNCYQTRGFIVVLVRNVSIDMLRSSKKPQILSFDDVKEPVKNNDPIFESVSAKDACEKIIDCISRMNKNVTYEKLLANQYPGNYFNLNTGLGGQSLNVTVTVNGSTFGNEIQY